MWGHFKGGFGAESINCYNLQTESRSVFVRIFHCCYLHFYLYLLPFHLCHCVNIYSNWLREQFCKLFLNVLYILSVQSLF